MNRKRPSSVDQQSESVNDNGNGENNDLPLGSNCNGIGNGNVSAYRTAVANGTNVLMVPTANLRYEQSENIRINGETARICYMRNGAPLTPHAMGGLSCVGGGMSCGTVGSIVTGPGGEVNKRTHHNRLERRRRASIKDCYRDLSITLHGLSTPKPSRAMILERCAEEMDELTQAVERARAEVLDKDANVQRLKAEDLRLQQLLESQTQAPVPLQVPLEVLPTTNNHEVASASGIGNITVQDIGRQLNPIVNVVDSYRPAFNQMSSSAIDGIDPGNSESAT